MDRMKTLHDVFDLHTDIDQTYINFFSIFFLNYDFDNGNYIN
jgi:hypothetical protein